jgi:hypothetical protein
VRGAQGFGSTNTCVRRWSTLDYWEGTDISQTDSASLGASFTINTDGIYAISYSDNFNAVGTLVITNTNNNLNTTASVLDVLVMQTTGGANLAGACNWIGYVPAGTVIRARTYAPVGGNGTLTASEHFSIVRVS